MAFLKEKSHLVILAAAVLCGLGRLDADAFVALVAGACALENPVPAVKAAAASVRAKVAG